MADSDGFVRNFRSAYYEKVGFCGIEEEKILDTILTSSPLDIEKLGDFCTRFDLARRREEAWKLLLGVQCNSKNPFDDEGKVVAKIRSEHFQLLQHHIEHLMCHNVIIRKRLIQICSSKLTGNHKLPETQLSSNGKRLSNSKDDACFSYLLSPHTITPGLHVTFMYFLESGMLNKNYFDSLDATECHVLSSIASMFVNVSSNTQMAFFMFKKFLRKLDQSSESLMAQYRQSWQDLAKDMPELDKHIRSVCDIDRDLPCWYWFRYCFFDILEEKATLRLWDKVISGCLKCLSRVFKVVFSELEPSIMTSSSKEDIQFLLTDKDKFCLREIPQKPQA